MTYEFFERCMNDVRRDQDWMGQLSECLNCDSVWDIIRCPDTLLLVITELLNDEDELIYTFVYDMDWGSRPFAGKQIKTLKELYDKLTAPKEEKHE